MPPAQRRALSFAMRGSGHARCGRTVMACSSRDALRESWAVVSTAVASAIRQACPPPDEPTTPTLLTPPCGGAHAVRILEPVVAVALGRLQVQLPRAKTARAHRRHWCHTPKRLASNRESFHFHSAMSHAAVHSIDDAVERLYNLNVGFVGTPEGDRARAPAQAGTSVGGTRSDRRGACQGGSHRVVARAA